MSYRTVEVEVEDPTIADLIDDANHGDADLIDIVEQVAGCLADRTLADVLMDAVREMTAIVNHNRYTPALDELQRQCDDLTAQNIRLCQMVRDLRRKETDHE